MENQKIVDIINSYIPSYIICRYDGDKFFNFYKSSSNSFLFSVRKIYYQDREYLIKKKKSILKSYSYGVLIRTGFSDKEALELNNSIRDCMDSLISMVRKEKIKKILERNEQSKASHNS